MSSYIGRHAELYDLFYADKPYCAEAEFVAGQLNGLGIASPARILEVACGTGRHARVFESLGFDVVAVDYSEDMLQAARQRGAELESKVDFRWADMRSLDLSDETAFDATVCLFDSIGYAQNNQDILAALKGMARHTRAGGGLVLEFWHAAAMLKSHDPVRVRRWKTEECEILRISETTLEPAQQLAHVKYTVYDLSALGSYSTFQETQTNRYFLVQEMAALLQMSGWIEPKWYAGFSQSTCIDASTWHVVVVARRANSLVSLSDRKTPSQNQG